MDSYNLRNLRLLKDLPKEYLGGKTVIYRSPYDIGTKKLPTGEYGIKDDSRIKATLPTLEYLIDLGCKIVILTWVGRPDGKVVEELRTTPHAKALSDLLGRPVQKADDCVGEVIKKQIASLKEGELLMLENTRFHPEEMVDDDGFAKELAKNGELVVFDGFPQAHRIHASTTGILRHLPGVVGFYMEREVDQLAKLMQNPQRPFTCIIGGVKISDKVDAINNLINIADVILIGGGVANVFLKAEGKSMGDSFIEDIFVDKVKKEKKDWVEYAKKIIAKTKKIKVYPFKLSLDIKIHKIIFPHDLLISNNKDSPQEIQMATAHENLDVVPMGWMALDIGTKTEKIFREIIMQSKSVFWNGPMGLFENENFSHGTKSVAESMLLVKGSTVISGGDTIEAAAKFIDTSKISHVSLAGGTSLVILSGKKLPCLELLKK